VKHNRNLRQSLSSRAMSGMARDAERRKIAQTALVGPSLYKPVEEKRKTRRALSVTEIGALAIIQSRAVFADGHYWLNEALQGVGYIAREVIKRLRRFNLIECRNGRIWVATA